MGAFVFYHDPVDIVICSLGSAVLSSVPASLFAWWSLTMR